MEKERKENGLLERHQAKLYSDKIKSERKYFQYADISQSLLENQKSEDLHFLQEAFLKWITSIPEGDSRKDELTTLLKSLWRVESYCGGLETVAKSSTVAVYQAEEKVKKLVSEKRILELEIKQLNAKHKIEKSNLEKEIEFTSKNS